MEEIEVVINITKHEWEYLNKLVENGDQLGHYERLLVNGTPLPQEPTLDKIRARIELEKLGYPPSAGYYKAIKKCLQIIDKYREESKGKTS